MPATAPARRLHGRDQTEDQAGEHGKRDSKDDHGAIHAHIVEPGDPLRLHADENLDPPNGKQQPETGAEQTEHHAFSEKLPDQPAAAGAECGANGHFRLARGRAGEQQVGDVDAGNQEHEAYGAEQHEYRPADVAHHRLEQRDSGEVQPCVRVRVLGRKLLTDGLNFGGNLLRRDPVPGATDRGQIPRASLA